MEPLLSFPRPLSPRMMQFLPTLKRMASPIVLSVILSGLNITDIVGLVYCLCSAAMGELFFFHVLISYKKVDPFDDSDVSSIDSSDFDSPEKPSSISSRDKAVLAAEKIRERLKVELDPWKPLPMETKRGPLMNPERNVVDSRTTAPLISKAKQPGSPVRFSSPRRQFSGSPTMFSSVLTSPKHKYRSSFDLKLTDVSRELETYISFQDKFYVLL
ncbi:hypothetical protein V6N11_015894 [Hibiscus sabdariffa]|uniref:Uncharacterized protein n=1 Tax=Hibiscus sabdariffa TaxID=183260 RepID=A0ABR2TTN1_9ROSI